MATLYEKIKEMRITIVITILLLLSKRKFNCRNSSNRITNYCNLNVTTVEKNEEKHKPETTIAFF